MPVYKAVDKSGNIVYIEDADINEEYFCPVCKAPLIIKSGSINAAHFAHTSKKCTDDWHYDMSEWHRRMQSYFPKEACEVVETGKDGKKHRADVLINEMVIEFQKSPITAKEITDRNSFFESLGYRIAWVFDVSDQFQKGNLCYIDGTDMKKMTWKNPLRVLSAVKEPFYNDSQHAVWLYFGDNKHNEKDIIYKVNWCTKDKSGNPNFKKIEICGFSITLNELTKIDDFFDAGIAYIRTQLLNSEGTVYVREDIPVRLCLHCDKVKPAGSFYPYTFYAQNQNLSVCKKCKKDNVPKKYS